jgi:hypothetical protein
MSWQRMDIGQVQATALTTQNKMLEVSGDRLEHGKAHQTRYKGCLSD